MCHSWKKKLVIPTKKQPKVSWETCTLCQPTFISVRVNNNTSVIIMTFISSTYLVWECFCQRPLTFHILPLLSVSAMVRHDDWLGDHPELRGYWCPGRKTHETGARNLYFVPWYVFQDVTSSLSLSLFSSVEICNFVRTENFAHLLPSKIWKFLRIVSNQKLLSKIYLFFSIV